MIYSKVLENVSMSNTILISDKAKRMMLDGHDVVSLSMGEPDLDTPICAKEYAIQAIQKGYTKYTALNGIPELKKEISNKLAKKNIVFDSSEIIVSNGGKQSIFNALIATINKEDNVLIPAPYWVSYPEMVSIAGGKSIICKTNERGILEANELEKNINQNTKWLILNSPSNPTGAVYTENDLMSLVNILLKYPNIFILSDDIYEDIVYDDIKIKNILNLAPELKHRTLIVNAVSKSYAMTGWRIGYAAGPKKLIDAMSVIQSQSTSCACSISQHAAIGAMKHGDDFIKNSCKIFQKRRDIAIKELEKIKNISFIKPHGAFYLFINCSHYIGKKTKNNLLIQNDTDLSAFILNEYKVAVVPGSDFGANGHIRISYATSEENIAKAISRIKNALEFIV